MEKVIVKKPEEMMQLTTRCHNLNRQASLKQTQIQCKSVLALHTDNNTVSH